MNESLNGRSKQYDMLQKIQTADANKVLARVILLVESALQVCERVCKYAVRVKIVLACKDLTYVNIPVDCIDNHKTLKLYLFSNESE